jgi:hypothetical protein
MRTMVTRLLGPGRFLTLIAAVALVGGPAAHAATFNYAASLSGANESPANASPGSGTCEVDVDDVLHTMHVRAVFANLLGNTTASHIHCATALPFAGTAGVATTTPTFAGFPLGVTSGTYDVVLDMTQASSYNPAFLTARGGSVAAAEAFIFASLAAGTAYLNIHSSSFGGGEIRGFPAPFNPTPTNPSTWGRIKSLYR